MSRRMSVMFSGALCALMLAACSGGGSSGDGTAVASGSGGAGSGSGSGSQAGSGSGSGTGKITCDWADAIEGTGHSQRKGVIQHIESDGTVVIDGISFATADASVVVNGSCAAVRQLGV